MKIIRRASAQWKGTGKEGAGTVSTQSGVLQQTPLTYASRFEEAKGTNPEELIGAAHAGCFSMKLSFVLVSKGFTADTIDVSAKVTLEDGKISAVHLDLNGKVPGISAAQFAEAAEEAKNNCPVSKSLNAQISMDAKLID
jgi:osmotically inducible protein OsmC